MLKELTIRNFAIIDDLTIRFADGLTILSGETGAGKSILINAVNLLLGSRASTDLVRTGTDHAELEALFDIPVGSPAGNGMVQNGFDPSEGLIVRRIISRTDSNRIYINGRLATIQVLHSITRTLASISGQHAHQGLLKEDRHLLVLDQFGGLTPQCHDINRCYEEMLPLIERLETLQLKNRQQNEQHELLAFQQQEIQSADIQPDEDVELARQRQRLKNAEQLYQSAYDGAEVLYGRAGSVFEQLSDVHKTLQKAAEVDPALTPPAEKIHDMVCQVEDATETLRAYLRTIDMDAGRLEAVEERLDAINRLKRKYGGTLETVSQRLVDITQELAAIDHLAEDIAETESRLAALQQQLTAAAVRLSQDRKHAAARFAECVVAELQSLMMPRTRFEVSLQPLTATDKTHRFLTADGRQLTGTGFDRARFLLAPNVGEALKPLIHIASGGELSRIVLALKVILAQSDAVETVIFDEVDAGIGGGVAEVVGQKLAELARHHQIICITHLPQIAKYGHQHLYISKEVTDGRTRTAIQPLDRDRRIKELARMLGGVTITQATLDHARELLENNRSTVENR